MPSSIVHTTVISTNFIIKFKPTNYLYFLGISATAPRELLYRCPSVIAAEYEVTVLNSVSALIAGCAFILYSSGIFIQQTYSIYFGSKEKCYESSAYSKF